MKRMEVITRTERRRTYSEAEKAPVVAEVLAPGVTVRSVARRLGIAESLVYNWRSAQRRAESISSEPLQFVSYSVVSDDLSAAPHLALTPPMHSAAPAIQQPPSAAAADLVPRHPGTRSGSIEISLPSGVRLSVDRYVNEKALARVLRTLRDAA